MQNILFQLYFYILAKTDPRSSLTVSLRQPTTELLVTVSNRSDRQFNQAIVFTGNRCAWL